MGNTMIKTARTALSVSALAIALLAGAPIIGHVVDSDIGTAHAQQGHGKGGAGGGHGGSGGSTGGHSSGSDSDHSDGTADEGSGGTSGGQKGPDADSDAKGPQYKGGSTSNQPGSGTRGGKPVWAQEGIPEIELGRLSVARSPSHVIDKAAAEALSTFDPEKSAELYSMTAEDFADYIKANFDTATIVDSPLQNLGLYKDIMADGTTQLSGVTPASTLDLAAIFLGSASDKTIPVTEDTVMAIETIMKLPALSDEQVTTLAEKAEDVRLAISEGHGE